MKACHSSGGAVKVASKGDRVDGGRGPRTDPRGAHVWEAGEPGRCRVTRATRPEGSGRRRLPHSSGTSRSLRTEKRPWGWRFGGHPCIVPLQMSPPPSRVPLPAITPGSASPLGSLPTNETTHSFFPRCAPDTRLLSLCCLNLHLSSCCSANVFIVLSPRCAQIPPQPTQEVSHECG